MLFLSPRVRLTGYGGIVFLKKHVTKAMLRKGKIELTNRGVFHWIDDGKTETKATIEIVAPKINS
jgi:hypothetical protein